MQASIRHTRNPDILSSCIAGIVGTSLFPDIKYLKPIILKKPVKNYNPAIRSIAPRRMPNMDVEADNIPNTIYPAINPIFRGI